MHAVFITFESKANADELQEPFTEYANALRDGRIPGFVSKTWLASESMIAGFHVFESRAAAERYLEEVFDPIVRSNQAFSDIQIKHFEVNEMLSAVTDGLPASLTPASA
jgi:hypothetical protein